MTTTGSFKVPEQFSKFLLLDDIRDYQPDYDPYVYLARSCSKVHRIPPIEGEIKEYVGVKSYLVPPKFRRHCVGKVHFNSVHMEGCGYFERDGTYVTGEQFESDGVPFEIIVQDRSFEGLDLSYYEPSDRLVNYLELHRDDRRWINPYTTDVIIKSGDGTRGWDPHDEFLAIRKSELTDYLSARKCGLLVTRYTERRLETPFDLLGLPKPFSSKKTKHGHETWIVDESPLTPGLRMYFSRLWESFWITPASKPRRWDAQPPSEFKDGVAFVMEDGETSTFGAGRDRYFEVISFRASVLRSFSAMPKNQLLWSCLTCCDLRYADAYALPGCINSEGQFQSFFGLVAKLHLEKQRHLSGYSEPLKAKPSYEYIRANIHAEWPETRPLAWTLSGALREVNSPWNERFGETLLLTAAEDEVPDILGPVTRDFDELADVMLELQKALIPERNIKAIKSAIELSELTESAQVYSDMRSIAYMRLLFKHFSDHSQDADTADVLGTINDLRNCKGHAKDIGTVLERHQLDKVSPRFAYLEVLRRLCLFLLEFRSVTEVALETDVGVRGRKGADDPWQQLQMIVRYCEHPF